MRIGSISWNEPFKKFVQLNIILGAMKVMVGVFIGILILGEVREFSWVFLIEVFCSFILFLLSLNAWIFSEHRWKPLAFTVLGSFLIMGVVLASLWLMVSDSSCLGVYSLIIFLIYFLYHFIVALIFFPVGYGIFRNWFEEDED